MNFSLSILFESFTSHQILSFGIVHFYSFMNGQQKNDEKNRKDKMIKKAQEIIRKTENCIYTDLVGKLKNYGLKQAQLLTDAIFYIIENFRTKLRHNLEWINSRTLRKSDSNAKNTILCCLMNLDRFYFLEYLSEFLKKKESKEEKIKDLNCDLQKILGNPSKNTPTIQPANEPQLEVLNSGEDIFAPSFLNYEEENENLFFEDSTIFDFSIDNDQQFQI